ncbi:CDIF630_02480 family spore surface protein [Natronospora cellulosivora (SeqCode)]
MDKKNNQNKENRMETPVENHQTAAWANIENLEGQARVFDPPFQGVEDAKEYVDDNEK